MVGNVLEGKVTVVTGGAGGIGEGIVRRVVGSGGRCIVADIEFERAEALAAELGTAAIAAPSTSPTNTTWRPPTTEEQP
jgi:NAD(P)-dependent dehydrogenase (short-subunit alcohol dehydrogenase family)